MPDTDYVPDRGHLIWLTFTPQAGREQAGRRPAIVLSPSSYNSKSNLAVVCPITNMEKGYPFEVKVSDGGKIAGVVLADQVRCLDWKQRKAEFSSEASPELLSDVLAKVMTLIDP